jgi:Rieske Fe-S protein
VVGIKVKRNSLNRALWWDTGNFKVNKDFPPYHYARLHPLNDQYDLLIVGGEDHPVGLADAEKLPEEDRYANIEKWAHENFEGLEDTIYKWSGEIMETMDGPGYIGYNPMDSKNVFIITGDSGNGITNGTIAGKLITDLITGHKNDWQEIYSPSRFKLMKAGKTFFKEFVGALVDYIKTKPKHLDKTGLKDIMKNEGKIIEFEGKKFGAYRDENDNIHFVASECTHQGCIVKWNNDEKSWDCPCHGSRFTYEGEVLHGPANEPLAYYSQSKNAIQNI